MYLRFDTYEAMDARNRKGLEDLNYPQGTTIKRWKEIELETGWYLDVGNGDGLTETELSNCVENYEP